MKKFFMISVFLFLTISGHADILVIGDSHTAGPFGEILHKSLTHEYPDKIILTYGHSSSAPIHWMSSKSTKLSGGLNHHFSINGQYYPHPNLPNWRLPAETLSLIDLFTSPILHSQWQKKASREVNINTIIIALGANDRGAVSDEAGNRTNEFHKRVQVIHEMLGQIESRNIKCIWIGPPSSPLRTSKLEQTSHEYLVEGIQDKCPLFDSRKFIALYCDKVHFSCKKGKPIVEKWANEAFTFVRENI